MRTRHPVLLTAAVLGALLTMTACVRARYVSAPPHALPVPDWSAAQLTQYVVLVSVDGLRPDVIDSPEMPTFARLMREGSYTLAATTIMPSKTLPSHTSMLTGQPPETHGVKWNTVLTAGASVIDHPTIFGVARARGFRTAAFFSKPKFQPLQRSGTLDYSQAPGGWAGGWKSTRTMRDVEKHLLMARPNVLFVHIPDPDFAGHSSGWMSPAYKRAVVASDVAIARLITASDAAFGRGNYTLIVTADHGGNRRNHGSDDPRDVTIPWIAWGRGVKPGHLDSPVKTVDTASTVLWLLGLDEPTEWPGAPVVGAFQAAVARSGS